MSYFSARNPPFVSNRLRNALRVHKILKDSWGRKSFFPALNHRTHYVSEQPRLNLELGIMQMIKMDASVQIGQLLSDIQELKKKVDNNDTGKVKLAASPTHNQAAVARHFDRSQK